MNVIHLVGKLAKAPEFFNTNGNKKMAKISLETWKHIRIKGEIKRNSQLHTIVCFNQFAIEFLENTAKVGSRLRVSGELSYDKSGKAEILVFQYSGELGPMDSDEFEFSDNSPSPSEGNSTTSTPTAPATTAKPGGGLGRLNLKKPKANDDKDFSPPVQGTKVLSDDELDDMIPF